jgi:hypothetical protein
METMVLERGSSAYLVNSAAVVRTQDDVSADLAAAVSQSWSIEKSNPMITWIAGDFVESDRPNSNKQFWTAGDLELAEYSILHAPLNMVHKFRTPVGFFAETKVIPTQRGKVGDKADLDELAAAAKAKPMKIAALSGLWSHIFPFENVQVEAANDAGLLFYSMECRGTHLTCAGPNGCGKTFEYAKVKTHCEHLMERASVRHIVNPTFRGGALIVPPVRPGWKNANASIVSDAVMQEAAAFAEQNEEQYNVLNAAGADLSASAWEQLMAQVIQSQRGPEF